MRLTIYDIARAAGVSAATVSKVINNTGRISEITKNRILEIMEEVNYHPNLLASAMKGKGTYQIALLIPDIDNPIYAQYLKHIEDCGQDYGFNTVMCSTDNDPKKEAQYITSLRQKMVDGFIIASQFSSEALLQELLQDRVPVLLFAHERPHLAIDSVTVDDYLGGLIATEHLISLGHRRIGVIGPNTFSIRERIRGYKEALRNAGIEYDENLIVISGGKMSDAEIAAQTLLNKADRPSAVFGCNDVMAIGTMKAARKRGISIPEELSVIGFDNTELCTVVIPELSSVAMPVGELARKAMDLLVAKIERTEEIKQRIRLLPEVVVRNSVSRR